jgi:hypothetical protein
MFAAQKVSQSISGAVQRRAFSASASNVSAHRETKGPFAEIAAIAPLGQSID